MADFVMAIAGELVAGDASFEVVNPATGEAFEAAPECSAAQLDQALHAATEAWPRWRAATDERREALRACSRVLTRDVDEIAALITAEQGKPLAQARGEVLFGSQWFDYYAELPWPEETVRHAGGTTVKVQRQSLGPVAAIVPWNFPVGSACMKLAPALLAGNPVVLKPSASTPLSMLHVGELLNPVLPAGVLAVVSGGAGLGAKMSSHPDVRKVTLTGSIPVGMKVAGAAAADLKRVTLELGGNDPAFVLRGADVEAAAAALAEMSFRNCGQICNAPKRIFVDESLHDAFVEALVARVRAFRVGDPTEPSTEVGPVSTIAQRDHVEELVTAARDAGARVVAGGERLPGDGSYYRPAVVIDARPEMSIVAEEQFGPALPVMAFDDLAVAVEQANGSRFGLGASVWTDDAELALETMEGLAAGSVWWNTHSELHPEVPMAGIKWSGVGVEHGTWGLESFLDLKVMWH
ncbi:MAG: aldehyde dehydrogenase family protein [Actinobacteria bacterium]|nr:aldehyde dehydrogenase family protein [Actinomycetota bacterium]